MTLAQAADGICSRQALHLFETGKARPAPPTLHAIAERLRVSADVILAGPHDPRERRMRELEDAQRWRELERVAEETLQDLNLPPRTQAIARFYLGRAIVDFSPEEALPHLRRARGMLARLGDASLAAQARDWEGAALYLLQSPDAIEVGRDALTRYRALADRDPAIESRMLEHLGTYLLQREEVVDALSNYREAIDVAGGSPINLARLGNIYHGLASGCLRIGESRKALEYFERAVAFSRSSHDVRGVVTANLARLENDYGDLLMRHGRWERAEEMIRAAIDHFDAIGVEANRAVSLLSMATLHHRQGKIAEAFLWASQAIEFAEKMGEPLSLALGYQRLGELWADEGDVDRVEASFARALEILDGAGMPEQRAEALARYHQARSDQREQQQAN